MQFVKMDQIIVDFSFNCRGEVFEHDVRELAEDIVKQGLLQPVIVSTTIDSDKYKLIAGFRRYVAHKLLKRDLIGAEVKQNVSDIDARVINLSENLHRQQLNVVQESRGVQILMNMNLGRGEIAKRLGMSPGWVQMRIMVANLPEEVQADVAVGTFKYEQIRNLVSWRNAYGTERMLEEARRMRAQARNGGRVTIKPPKPQKRVRTMTEIVDLIGIILSQNGGVTSDVTLSLAYVSGNLSDTEYVEAMQDFIPGFVLKDISNIDSVELARQKGA